MLLYAAADYGEAFLNVSLLVGGIILAAFIYSYATSTKEALEKVVLMHKFFTQMELPDGEYKEIQRNVKNVDNGGSGCMVFIGIILTASLMAACSLL